MIGSPVGGIRAAAIALVALVVAGVLAGCGAGSSGSSAEPVVDAAWARPTPPTAVDGVLYLTVTSDVDDALVAVEVPDAVAAEAQLHETSGADGGHLGHGGGAAGGGEVTMAQVAEVELPAGVPVVFEPGGNHVMLVDLARPLERGDAFEVELVLESGRRLTATAEVAANPPTG